MFWLLAQQAQGVPQPPAADGRIVFLLVVLVLIVPYILGALIAKWLRMKEFGSRFGTILLAIAATTVPFFYRVGAHIEDAKAELVTVN